MAKSREDRRGRAEKAGNADSVSHLRFSRVNLILGVAGLTSIALGYFLLSQGSITAAPLLLVLGYVGLLPLALIL